MAVLTLKAAGLLALIRVALWLVPFPRVLAGARAAAGRRGLRTAPADVGDVVTAVTRAARVVPSASCLTQALAANVMLGRRGYDAALRLGARADEGTFEAHAWLELDGAAVIGDAGDLYVPFPEGRP